MPAQRRALSPSEASSLAFEAYLFLYPLVLMGAFREIWTHKPNVFYRLSAQQLRRVGAFLPPYAYALGSWLDLSAGPVLVTLPQPHGQHIIARVIDPWGETVASINSREFEGLFGRYVFAGPDWHDELTAIRGIPIFRVASRELWIGIRIIGRSEEDYEAQRGLAQKCHAVLLGAGAVAASNGARFGSGVSPKELVEAMSLEEFFSKAAHLLQKNPLHREDRDFIDVFQQLGIQPGELFSLSQFRDDTVRFIQNGVTEGVETVFAEYDRRVQLSCENWETLFVQENGGKNYLNRAATVHWAPHAARPEDHLQLTTSRDSEGEPLHGSRRYRLRFGPGKTPPTDGFWSLSLVDQANSLLPKAAHSIPDCRVHPNLDGSLDLHFGAVRFGRQARGFNEVVSPPRAFRVVLEMVAPRSEVIDGEWRPPRVERTATSPRPIDSEHVAFAPSFWRRPQGQQPFQPGMRSGL